LQPGYSARGERYPSGKRPGSAPALVEPPFPRDGEPFPEGYTPKFFPYVEAWYRGPIPASVFARHLVFGEPDKAIEHRSVPIGPDALEEITAIGAEWARRRAAYLKELDARSAATPPDPGFEEMMGAAKERVAKLRAREKQVQRLIPQGRNRRFGSCG